MENRIGDDIGDYIEDYIEDYIRDVGIICEQNRFEPTMWDSLP